MTIIDHQGFNDYFPEGYYQRFLDDNDLEDDPAARTFFQCVVALAGNQGEESVQELGNYLAQRELNWTLVKGVTPIHSRLSRRVK